MSKEVSRGCAEITMQGFLPLPRPSSPWRAYGKQNLQSLLDLKKGWFGSISFIRCQNEFRVAPTCSAELRVCPARRNSPPMPKILRHQSDSLRIGNCTSAFFKMPRLAIRTGVVTVEICTATVWPLRCNSLCKFLQALESCRCLPHAAISRNIGSMTPGGGKIIHTGRL